MSSPATPNKKTPQKQRDLEKRFVKLIRKQLNANKNWNDAAIAKVSVTVFKAQQHMNCFDALRECWDEYRFENMDDDDDDGGDQQEKEEGSMEDTNCKPLAIMPELTKASSAEEPDTVESLIMDRHVYELLYNLLLASHCDMAQRKIKLMNHLDRNEQIAKKENRQKKTQIIAKYLPQNEQEMKKIVNRIFDEIVVKHYSKKKSSYFPVFVKMKKKRIIDYIKAACSVSFEMLFADHELSFFPLLFTDQSTSYIAPVVRYDKIIKKWQKNNENGKMSRTPKLEPQKRKRLYSQASHARAGSEFHEGMLTRSFASFHAKQILFYTFPGIIDAENDHIHEKAEAFTHDDPSIFLRHDMNWIFTDDYIKDKRISKYIKAHSVPETESDEDNPFVQASNDTDPYHEIVSKSEMKMEAIVENNDIIKHTEFTSTAQLIQDWATLKAQHFNQLVELLLDHILDLDANDDSTDDIKSDVDAEDNEEEEPEEDDMEEYIGNKKAAQFLLEVMNKCRYIMGLKTQTSSLMSSHNASYLNMTKIYKAFTGDQKADQFKLLGKHVSTVKPIVDGVFDEVLKQSEFKEYSFVRSDTDINQKVHEFIAQTCQLITSVLHHEWDLYPDLKALQDSKCLTTFDGRIHLKDKTLPSVQGSETKIGYLSYPGLINKADAEQFDQLYEKNAMDKDKIDKAVVYKMIVCLNDKA